MLVALFRNEVNVQCFAKCWSNPQKSSVFSLMLMNFKCFEDFAIFLEYLNDWILNAGFSCLSSPRKNAKIPFRNPES